jgi:hypothetical protein
MNGRATYPTTIRTRSPTEQERNLKEFEMSEITRVHKFGAITGAAIVAAATAIAIVAGALGV